MRYRVFGRTGISVSEVVFGGGRSDAGFANELAPLSGGGLEVIGKLLRALVAGVERLGGKTLAYLRTREYLTPCSASTAF